MYISTNLMEDISKLQLTAGVEDLAKIRHWLRTKAAKLHINPSTTYDILLAVTELVTNTLLYGYQDKSGFIEVEMGRDGDDLVIHLRDKGEAFDPTLVPPPDISLPLDKRPIGGMGIYLTKQLVDRIAYQRLPQGENEITLAIDVKNRTNQKEDSHAHDD